MNLILLGYLIDRLDPPDRLQSYPCLKFCAVFSSVLFHSSSLYLIREPYANTNLTRGLVFGDHLWQYVTQFNGYYSFSSSYDESVSYFISFMKDGYYTEYYGPFYVQGTTTYEVEDIILYSRKGYKPTMTPEATPPMLPPIPATATPGPFHTCTPTSTPVHSTPEPCGQPPPTCEFYDCECHMYRPYFSKYGFPGGAVYIGVQRPAHGCNICAPCVHVCPHLGNERFYSFQLDISSDCFPEPMYGTFTALVLVDPICEDESIVFNASYSIPLFDPCPPYGTPVISECQFGGEIPIVTPSIVSESNLTGPRLDYLTFDSDGVARVRLRIHPDPRAEISWSDTRLEVKSFWNSITNGYFPFKYSENNMIFTDPVWIYQDIYNTIPENLRCDTLIVEERETVKSVVFNYVEYPVISVDFLAARGSGSYLMPTKKLKISKWENAFGMTGPSTPTPVWTPQFIETDPYRFQIRVVDTFTDKNGPPGTLTISSRRWVNQTPVPVDDETEMDLHPLSTGIWITDPMILVSDEVDDAYFSPGCPIFGVRDNHRNDRTHRVTIDSEIVARYYPVMPDPTPTPTSRMNAPEPVLTTPTPHVIENIATMEYETFRFHPVIFETINDEGTPAPVIDPLWVLDNVDIINTIYASVGVKVEAEPIQIITPPPGIDIMEVVVGSDNYHNILSSVKPPSDLSSDVYVVFVDRLFGFPTAVPTMTPPPGSTSTPVPTMSPTPAITPTPPPGSTATPTPQDPIEILGAARYHHECQSTPTPPYNVTLLNARSLEEGPYYTTVAHEIGHCLTRYGHFEKFGNLMSEGNTERVYPLFDYDIGIFARKRFSDTPMPTPTACNHSPTPKNQEDRIHEHDQVN